jgi:hypothetical protein
VSSVQIPKCPALNTADFINNNLSLQQHAWELEMQICVRQAVVETFEGIYYDISAIADPVESEGYARKSNTFSIRGWTSNTFP